MYYTSAMSYGEQLRGLLSKLVDEPYSRHKFLILVDEREYLLTESLLRFTSQAYAVALSKRDSLPILFGELTPNGRHRIAARGVLGFNALAVKLFARDPSVWAPAGCGTIEAVSDTTVHACLNLAPEYMAVNNEP